MRTEEVVRQRRARQKKRFTAALLIAALVISTVAAAATPAMAQTTQATTVEIIEWDLPTPEQIDARPGAVMVDVTGDSNRLWFVTRIGSGPRVYRMEFKGGKKVANPQWFSWGLDPANSGVANGLRRIKTSSDRRFVFVHTGESLQRIDTLNCTTTTAGTTCPRTLWRHDGALDTHTPALDNASGSDVAIDEYSNAVYAVIGAVDPLTFAPVPEQGFIQRLNPNASTSNVTRWYVGGSVGQCPTAFESGPCLSGVAIDRRNRDLVYYSEPTGCDDGSGAIGELNTRYATVRRWCFSKLSTPEDAVREPRQLVFDHDGTLWAVTGSGHLVSLDPRKNRMSKHQMPASFGTDPFGVAPDGGLIGYTNSSSADPKVGMLMPARRFATVSPVGPTPVDTANLTIASDSSFPADRTAGGSEPHSTKVTGQIVRNQDGTFSEAQTTSAGIFNPLGITQDQTSSSGTFFFAIGDAISPLQRIGRVRLPRKDMHGNVERDDDDKDDDGKRADVDDDVDGDGIGNAFDPDSDNDGIPDMLDDDDDDDGIEDSFDTKNNKEGKQTSDQDVAAGSVAESPFTLNASTLLVVASAISTDPLAQVKIEIVDAAGTVVASSLSAAGTSALTWVPPAAGGDYTMRVKNQGLNAASISTKLLTRELWPVVF